MLPEPEPIGIELRPARMPTFPAVVSLRGEHDLSTRSNISGALAPIDCDVLLDLSECEFIDAAVIGVVLAKSRELGREGHRLELLIREGTHVARTLQMVALQDVMTVHQEPRGG
jgi:anti-anti-sigma factor